MCLAQKLFSAFMWKRDRKGEEGLSSSKAVSTLDFFLSISYCCSHGCSLVHSGTDDSVGAVKEANVSLYMICAISTSPNSTSCAAAVGALDGKGQL